MYISDWDQHLLGKTARRDELLKSPIYSNPSTKDKTVTEGIERTLSFGSKLMIMTINNLTIRMAHSWWWFSKTSMIEDINKEVWDGYCHCQGAGQKGEKSTLWGWEKGHRYPVWLQKGSATICKPTSDGSSCNPGTIILKDQQIHQRTKSTVYSYRYSGYIYL